MKEDVRDLIEKIKETEDHFQKAKYLEYLNKEKGETIKNLASYLDMKQSYLCHLLRLNRIPEIVKDGYYSQLITLSHLFVISRLKSGEDIIQLYEKILSESLTVLQSDYLVREILHNVSTSGERVPKSEIQNLADELRSVGDYNVRIVQTRIKATITIEIQGGLTKTTEALRKLISHLNKNRES